MFEQLGLHIKGRWLTESGRTYEEVLNPATEEVLGRLPHATREDLAIALESAQDAFPKWRAESAHRRAEVLRGAAALLRQRAESIARTLTLEQGKPLTESRGEVMVSAEILEWFAGEAIRAYGKVIPSRDGQIRQMVLREPVGPVLALTPWNFPIFTPASKVGAALAAGCTCIIKASEETPGSCVAMVRALQEAGLPPGVLNLVFGVPAEISEQLIASPVIRHISFTGPIPIGKRLAELAAKGMKRNTMELGGHAPVIVCEDSDPDRAAALLAARKFRNAGQVCIAPSRFYVHEKVYEKFVDRFVSYAESLIVGNGLDSKVQMGPLAHKRRFTAVEQLVDDALGHGATLATGGKRIGDRGYFYAPTVLTQVPDHARIMLDETFGPVAPISMYKSLDEVIAKANALPYGLAAFAFTASSARAHKLSEALECGMVGVNTLDVSFPETPFGGVKESGYGFELGSEGLDDFVVKKFVAHMSA